MIKELDEHVAALQRVMVEEEARQKDDLAIKMAPLGFDIAAQLQLSQLPSDLLGGGGGGGGGEDALRKEIADLRAKLEAANDRIAYLEGGMGATKAAQQINELRKRMVQAKAMRGPLVAGEDPKSKACVVS